MAIRSQDRQADAMERIADVMEKMLEIVERHEAEKAAGDAALEAEKKVIVSKAKSN